MGRHHHKDGEASPPRWGGDRAATRVKRLTTLPRLSSAVQGRAGQGRAGQGRQPLATTHFNRGELAADTAADAPLHALTVRAAAAVAAGVAEAVSNSSEVTTVR